jgi:hypothetical protein
MADHDRLAQAVNRGRLHQRYIEQRSSQVIRLPDGWLHPFPPPLIPIEDIGFFAPRIDNSRRLPTGSSESDLSGTLWVEW